MLLLFVQLCFYFGKTWEQFLWADTDNSSNVCLARSIAAYRLCKHDVIDNRRIVEAGINLMTPIAHHHCAAAVVVVAAAAV